jgi:predicted nucleotide-binding protein (sugar kinase/HSP70/actin superfamily)
MDTGAERGQRLEGSGHRPLNGKTIFIPPMAFGSARAFAAGFRALGVDARLTDPSDVRTLELGAKHTSGDECYPAKVTIGDFLKVLERSDCDPARTVFFMPTADGPCRFGQYAPFLRQLLDAKGLTTVDVLSPTSHNAYGGLGDLSEAFARTAWRMLVAADILQKLLLQHRPYEQRHGATDAVYEECVDDVCESVQNCSVKSAPQMRALLSALERCRRRFASLDIRPDPGRPLIGVVGEIFCRLNVFSNEDAVRRLEELGGEVWLSGITEWIWYMVPEQFRKLRLKGRLLSTETVSTWLRAGAQHRDEARLRRPFKEDFCGYEEPDVAEVIAAAQPYLPADGALGEMVLSIGRTVRLAARGVDGIIDISPFTCMNGIVCEAIYPRVSRDLDGLPIRSLYFDGVPRDLEGDLGVYLNLTHNYRLRKTTPRPRPVPLARAPR